MSIDAVRIQAEFKEKSERQFVDWLERQETKLLLSMVPEATNPDVVKTLLRSAFDAGASCGQGQVMVSMLTAIFAKKEPK